nr:MAG TPA: hypothetical protein [Caudoviricetes sp.]
MKNINLFFNSNKLLSVEGRVRFSHSFLAPLFL